MKKIIVCLSIVVIASAFIGCSSEKFGAGIDRNSPGKKVKDVFLDSGLIGKAVTLEGRVSSQCGSNGCWFVLQDDTGQIFINLAPNNMTLPPRMNKTARVTGLVYPFEGEIQLVAQGVEIR